MRSYICNMLEKDSTMSTVLLFEELNQSYMKTHKSSIKIQKLSFRAFLFVSPFKLCWELCLKKQTCVNLHLYAFWPPTQTCSKFVRRLIVGGEGGWHHLQITSSFLVACWHLNDCLQGTSVLILFFVLKKHYFFVTLVWRVWW